MQTSTLISNPPKTNQKQTGQALIGLLFLIFLAGWIWVAVKVFPAYLNYYRVHRVLQEASQMQGLAHQSTDEIKRYLNGQFMLESIPQHLANNIKITQITGGAVQISVPFEEKQHIVANVYVWLVFDPSVKVGNLEKTPQPK